MEKLQFAISIDAPKEKVWSTLWNDQTYRKWTSVFSPTSYAESGWNEGDKILFLDGKGSGMVSKIAAKRPPEFMSFQHLGMITNGIEDTESETVKGWAGALENYTLKDESGGTKLEVDVDVAGEFKAYMEETFPKALKRLKTLSEDN